MMLSYVFDSLITINIQIHHLLYSYNHSINWNIKIVHNFFEYTSINKPITLVLNYGKGCILMKKDINAVFRHILVSKVDWWLWVLNKRGYII